MGPPTKPHPSIAKQLRVVADYLDGIPMKTIEAKFGVSTDAVRTLARKCGCPPREAIISQQCRAGFHFSRRQKRDLLDHISIGLQLNQSVLLAQTQAETVISTQRKEAGSCR